MVQRFSILIVDDDPNIRKLLHELLDSRPEYLVLIAEDGKQAVKIFAEQRIDIALTDIHMPGFTGLEMMADMKKIHQLPELLVMTANGTPENVEKARQLGARGVILKPFENLDIIEMEVEKAAEAVAAARAKGERPEPTSSGPEVGAGPDGAGPITPPVEPTNEAVVPVAPEPAPIADPDPSPTSTSRPVVSPVPTTRREEKVATKLADAASPSAGGASRDPEPREVRVHPDPPPATPAIASSDISVVTTRMEIPRIDAWQDEITGNEPPPASRPSDGSPDVSQRDETPTNIEGSGNSSTAERQGTSNTPAQAVSAGQSVRTTSAPTATHGAAPGPGRSTAPGREFSKLDVPVRPAEERRARIGFPNLQTLRKRLFGPRSQMDDGGSRARHGGEELLEESRPALPRTPAPAMEGQAGTSRVAESSIGEVGGTETAAIPPPEVTCPAPVPQAVEIEKTPAVTVGLSPAQQDVEVPQIPAELESIFMVGVSLAIGKLKMQVPIICLQTWEEQLAITALRRFATTLQREFHTWSATRGIVKEGDQSMGEMYCDPIRALEFIRRQQGNGLYALVDFRSCLDNGRVVRSLREMFMENEIARCMIVLIAPVLPVPPELQPATKMFSWPETGSDDFGEVLEAVRAEVATSSGHSVNLDPETRRLLIERVQGMPAGRARFELACALMARVQRGG